MHRRPIDSTFVEPNVIVGKPHPAIKPKTPGSVRVPLDQLDGDTRQARHVVKTWDELRNTKHPLPAERSGVPLSVSTRRSIVTVRTTPVDTDIIAVWFGPFGDMLRHDHGLLTSPKAMSKFIPMTPGSWAVKTAIMSGSMPIRRSSVPQSGKSHRGRQNWDGCWCGSVTTPERPRRDAHVAQHVRRDPTDRSKDTSQTRTVWHAIQRPATKRCSGTVVAELHAQLHQTDDDDGHDGTQNSFTQQVGQGSNPMYCPTGAPRESFVKIRRAEAGGMGGKGL